MERTIRNIIKVVLTVCVLLLSTMVVPRDVQAKETSTRQVNTPIQINDTNFPDENFRKYLIETLKLPATLTQSDIDQVTVIEVDNQGISSLKGIEYFTKLERLECYSNQLTELDVSQNTALISLNCNSNQLTELDVSQNTALTELNCYSNQLTELDVSQNTALVSLVCNSNQLTSLDLSNHINLESLDCSNNQLVSLSLPNKVGLTIRGLSLQTEKRIAANLNDEFDLSSLDKDIKASQIKNVTGATLQGTVLKNLQLGNLVTYEYDAGNNQILEVYLRVVWENVLTTPLSIKNWTYGEQANQPVAVSRVGTPTFVYSQTKEGTYTTNVPSQVGTWYVKAVVEGTTYYDKLESQSVEFKIVAKDLSTTSISNIQNDQDVKNLIIKDGNKTLTKDSDYKVEILVEGNKTEVRIKGIGNYTGEIVREYVKEVIEMPDKPKPETPDNPKIPEEPKTEIKDNIKTNDNANIGLYVVMIGITGVSLLYVFKKKRI